MQASPMILRTSWIMTVKHIIKIWERNECDKKQYIREKNLMREMNKDIVEINPGLDKWKAILSVEYERI